MKLEVEHLAAQPRRRHRRGLRASPTSTSYTAGFHPAELVIVAARPSMGKTAICLNITQHVGLKTGQVRRLLLDGNVQGVARHPDALRRRR